MKVKMKRIEAEKFDGSEVSIAKIIQCCLYDGFTLSIRRTKNNEIQVNQTHIETKKSNRKYVRQGEWIANMFGKIEVFTQEEFERIFCFADGSEVDNEL